jgi:hypothetical protein
MKIIEADGVGSVSGWKETQNSCTSCEEILWEILMERQFKNRF